MAELRLDDAYAAHHDLLQKVETADDVTKLVPVAESLVERVRRLGVNVTAPQTRDYLASMLNFWGSWLYSQTRNFPNTDLYPPDMPSPGALRPLTLSYMTDSPLVINAQAVPVPTAEAQTAAPAPIPTNPTTGTGVLMVGILQPENGARIDHGTFVTLAGMYTRLRPDYRVFFIRHGADDSFVVLDSGYAPEAANGTWRVTSSAFDQTGMFGLGIAIAITPDAAQALSAAHEENSVLTDAPLGALMFSQLAHVYIY